MTTLPCSWCGGYGGLYCNGGCRRQTPGWIGPYYPPYHPVYPFQPVEKGCICPPGSERTCQRLDCGRKSPNTQIYWTTGNTAITPNVAVQMPKVDRANVSVIPLGTFVVTANSSFQSYNTVSANNG